VALLDALALADSRQTPVKSQAPWQVGLIRQKKLSVAGQGQKLEWEEFQL